jgi:solute carrier family 25 protein 39/40
MGYCFDSVQVVDITRQVADGTCPGPTCELTSSTPKSDCKLSPLPLNSTNFFSMDPFHAKVVAAAAGSSITALTMTPFDVVKTRLQTQPIEAKRLFPARSTKPVCQPGATACVRQMSSLARNLAHEQLACVCVWDQGVIRTERVNGFTDAVRHVWKAEGMRGLWKGAGTTLVIGVPASTTYMLTYDHLLNVVLPPLLPSTAVPLTAGIIARGSIVSLLSPLELIRTNLQSTPSGNSPNTLRSVLTSVRSLAQERGFRSLWRGLGPTLWRDVPFSGIYWATYETLKKQFARHNQEGAWVAFMSGATSGVTAALFTSPFDVLKTRQQALIMAPTAPARISASLPFLLHIVRTEGANALFAGILPRVAKIAPACGIMIACFEGFGKLLTQH